MAVAVAMQRFDGVVEPRRNASAGRGGERVLLRGERRDLAALLAPLTACAAAPSRRVPEP